MIRDQIIIGITNNNIRRNGLDNQWGGNNLTKNRGKLEAATTGGGKLNVEGAIRRAEGSVNRVSRPGKYSKKIIKRS